MDLRWISGGFAKREKAETSKIHQISNKSPKKDACTGIFPQRRGHTRTSAAFLPRRLQVLVPSTMSLRPPLDQDILPCLLPRFPFKGIVYFIIILVVAFLRAFCYTSPRQKRYPSKRISSIQEENANGHTESKRAAYVQAASNQGSGQIKAGERQERDQGSRLHPLILGGEDK